MSRVIMPNNEKESVGDSLGSVFSMVKSTIDSARQNKAAKTSESGALGREHERRIAQYEKAKLVENMG